MGAIQGITEWLPISSGGISSLVMIKVFHLPPSEAISQALWLHLGTLAAAVYYFRRELVAIGKHVPAYIKDLRHPDSSSQGSLITYLVVATLASLAIGGILFFLVLDRWQLPGSVVTATIGVFLIITGVIQRYAYANQNVENKVISVKDSLLVGIAQGFSVLPGLSRSGLTTSVLLFRRYANEQAFRLSFLLGIPSILLAEVGLTLTGDSNFSTGAIFGILASAVLGFLTIKGLMAFALRVAFWKFCIVLGVLSLLSLLFAL